MRKKRNFNNLALNVTSPTSPTVEEPVATRTAPGISGKRRPAPMTLKPKPGIGTPSGNAADTGGAPSASLPSSHRQNYHQQLSDKLGELDMNAAPSQLELRGEDLEDVRELGAGNGGSVKQVIHRPTNMSMAKKIILIDAKPSVRKQILRELQIMHDCNSNYIISFYGAFIADPNICMCIEFMDKGSLDGIYKKIGAIDINIVGKVALAVLEGLTYLYDVHRIIHRDIKPSNILCNSKGEIKICDFGVSGELINSIADTFVGTSTYMSPERIQGAQYTVKSDVWSLGISLIELALGRFPFSDSPDDDSDLSDFEGTLSPSKPAPMAFPPSSSTAKKDKRKSKGVSLQGGGMTMSILELLQHIVNEPAPKLTPGTHPAAEAFVDSCLLKDPEARKTPKELLKDPWIDQAREDTVDLAKWASEF
ncbi:Pkinase-domain-containing protein [Flagelloscypha sp. PMI_526]|nr:Pkinase-domain-containing protein [Flagelloscypha sp. PMI_526]